MLDAGFLRELQQYHPGGDLCGEKDEYHTLVTDGPLFKQRRLKDKYGRATMERWLLAPGEHGLCAGLRRGRKKRA
jgi:diphthamide synthase (EF-2-diphthine--ammonia ligase)